MNWEDPWWHQGGREGPWRIRHVVLQEQAQSCLVTGGRRLWPQEGLQGSTRNVGLWDTVRSPSRAPALSVRAACRCLASSQQPLFLQEQAVPCLCCTSSLGSSFHLLSPQLLSLHGPVSLGDQPWPNMLVLKQVSEKVQLRGTLLLLHGWASYY